MRGIGWRSDQALAVATGAVPVSGVGQMPVLVEIGASQSWQNPGHAPAVACQGCVLWSSCELNEVEIKCLDPKQRPVQGGLITIGNERRVRAVEARA